MQETQIEGEFTSNRVGDGRHTNCKTERAEICIYRVLCSSSSLTISSSSNYPIEAQVTRLNITTTFILYIHSLFSNQQPNSRCVSLPVCSWLWPRALWASGSLTPVSLPLVLLLLPLSSQALPLVLPSLSILAMPSLAPVPRSSLSLMAALLCKSFSTSCSQHRI